MVDICLGHHREVRGVLPIMKRHRVLDRDASQAAEPIEIKRGNIALWSDDCSMGGNGGLALNWGIARRDDCRGIRDDLNAIGSGEQGSCCHRLGVGGGVVKGHGALPHSGRRVAGAGGRHALALERAADFQEACGNLLTCWVRGAGGERRDSQGSRERLGVRHQRHRCGQGCHRSDEDGNEHQGKQVQEETAA